MKIAIAVACATLLTTGCSGGGAPASGGIGLVDVVRLRDHWPKFKRDDAELGRAMEALERSSDPPATKARRRDALRARFQRMQDDVTGDVRRAADEVAKAKNLPLVLTRESVGYGGVDVTADVEKKLGIDESASPTP